MHRLQVPCKGNRSAIRKFRGSEEARIVGCITPAHMNLVGELAGLQVHLGLEPQRQQSRIGRGLRILARRQHEPRSVKPAQK